MNSHVYLYLIYDLYVLFQKTENQNGIHYTVNHIWEA